MSNVSTKPFVPMNAEYAHLNQPSVQVNRPLELSPAEGNVSKFLKDSSPAPKENNLTVNKESLEKLFAMFEFAVKAMRSMLAGMGMLPKMPGELDAQSQLRPGLDPKVVADTNGKPKIEPQTDAKTQVKPSSDPKVIADTSVKPKIEPQTDARTRVTPGPDPKVVADTNFKPGIEPLADAETLVKPGPDVKVKPDGQAQVTMTPDGKHATKPALTSLTDTAQNNKLSSDVRPPAPKSNDLPVPQPRVQVAPDTTSVDKPKEPIPELSTRHNGAKPNNIWNGFRQGSKGNCVTVSAIKGAMAKFGQSPTDIYKSVEKVADGFKVVMRDGFALTLKKTELESAIRDADFVPMNDREMLKDAHFLFACSAKRAQIENNDGFANRSFDAAIRSLNDREDESGPGEGLKRLGLKDHMKHVSARDLADKSLIGMVNRRGHSVAVVDGSEEYYGRRGGRPTSGQAIALV